MAGHNFNHRGTAQAAVRCCLLLAALGCLAAAPLPEVRPEQFIDRLGKGDVATRQAAAWRLLNLGEDALPALREAARHHVLAEVRQHAALLIAAIERDEVRTVGDGGSYWLNRVAFLPDGRQVVATGGAVITFDLEHAKETRRVLELNFARIGLDVTRDGSRFVTGHQHDRVVRIGDARTGAVLKSLEGHTDGVHAAAFTPDGKRVLTGGLDKSLRLWDADTAKEIRQFDGVGEQVRCIAISPDGKQALSGHFGAGSSFSIYLWDIETGKKMRTYPLHVKDVTAVRFLPDGTKFFSAGMDGRAHVIDLAADKQVHRMTHEGGIYGAAVSADGRRAVTGGFGDKTVRLWDLTTGKELRAYKGHVGAVLGVDISADGARAASSDSQNTIRVWRLPP